MLKWTRRRTAVFMSLGPCIFPEVEMVTQVQLEIIRDPVATPLDRWVPYRRKRSVVSVKWCPTEE